MSNIAPFRLNHNAKTTGALQTLKVILGVPAASYSIQVTGLAADGVTRATPTSWTVNLEGSNDNIAYDTILAHTNSSPGDGKLAFSDANRRTTSYVRVNVSALVLGPADSIQISVAAIS